MNMQTMGAKVKERFYPVTGEVKSASVISLALLSLPQSLFLLSSSSA